MTQIEKKNLFQADSNFISFDDDDDLKTSESRISVYDIIEELTISNTLVSNNHVTRSTQTINKDVADLKSIEALYNNLNKVKKINIFIILITMMTFVNNNIFI